MDSYTTQDIVDTILKGREFGEKIIRSVIPYKGNQDQSNQVVYYIVINNNDLEEQRFTYNTFKEQIDYLSQINSDYSKKAKEQFLQDSEILFRPIHSFIQGDEKDFYKALKISKKYFNSKISDSDILGNLLYTPYISCLASNSATDMSFAKNMVKGSNIFYKGINNPFLSLGKGSLENTLYLDGEVTSILPIYGNLIIVEEGLSNIIDKDQVSTLDIGSNYFPNGLEIIINGPAYLSDNIKSIIGDKGQLYKLIVNHSINSSRVIAYNTLDNILRYRVGLKQLENEYMREELELETSSKTLNIYKMLERIGDEYHILDAVGKLDKIKGPIDLYIITGLIEHTLYMHFRYGNIINNLTKN